MKRRPGPDVAETSDAAVSAAYKAVATEKTPAHLDRAVMAEAQSALRRAVLPARRWLQPAAVAATLLLGIAVVLRVSETQGPGEPMTPGELAEPPRPAIPNGGTSPPPADSRHSAAPQTIAPAGDAAGRLRELDRAVQRDIRSGTAPGVRQSAADVRAPDVVQRYCDDGGDARTWWHCIEQLVEQGRIDTAQSELVLFRRSNPDFQP